MPCVCAATMTRRAYLPGLLRYPMPSPFWTRGRRLEDPPPIRMRAAGFPGFLLSRHSTLSHYKEIISHRLYYVVVRVINSAPHQAGSTQFIDCELRETVPLCWYPNG